MLCLSTRTIPASPKHRKEVFPVFVHIATVFVHLLLIQPKPRKPLLPTAYPLNFGQKENPLRLENPGSSMLRPKFRFNSVSSPLMGTASLNGVSPR